MAQSFLAYLDTTSPFDTIRTMEAAAQSRFWDGLQLATHPGHETAAVYMLGYAMEMLVKTAYYRFRNIPPVRDVSNPGSVLKGLSVAWPSNKNYHVIETWADLLVNERNQSQNRMNPVTAGQLKFHITRVMVHWRETLRYTPVKADEAVVVEVFGSVEWLLKHHSELWR